MTGTITKRQAEVTPPLRIVHLTDIHVQPERGVPDRVAAYLKAIEDLRPAPDLVLNGGDIVSDAVAADRARVDLLWDLWDRLKSDFKLPMRYCLGNHDIWGWNKKSGCTGREPLFGKAYPLDRMELERGYYHFDQGGWRIVVLDSIVRLDKASYVARLDREQRVWLEETLAATDPDMPVLVLSHVPITGGPAVFFANAASEIDETKDTGTDGDWIVPAWQMHVDSRSLIDLFSRYPNVKLCLSGHTHLYERLEFRGVTYINNGALCGQWWRGEFLGTPNGYGLLDLWPAGRFTSEYVSLV